MTKPVNEHIKQSIEDEAVAWHSTIVAGDCSDADITRHMEWMLADPAHLDAYERVAQAYQAVGQYEAVIRNSFAGDMRNATNATKHAPWYVRLQEGWSWPQSAALAAGALALLFFVLVPETFFYDNGAKLHTYAAREGHIKAVKLIDGSRATLFAGAKMDVTIEADSRNITLTRGRVFFDVVSDKARPFYVNTGKHQVKVVGTRFEVIHTPTYDRVSVNEGLVAVASLTSDDDRQAAVEAPLLIEPGISAFYGPKAEAPVLTAVNPDSIGAWTEGMLTFRQAKLTRVVTEIDQLFPGKNITIGDESLDDMVFSGTLIVSDAEKMMHQLADFLGLDIIAGDTHITLMPK